MSIGVIISRAHTNSSLIVGARWRTLCLQMARGDSIAANVSSALTRVHMCLDWSGRGEILGSARVERGPGNFAGGPQQSAEMEWEKNHACGDRPEREAPPPPSFIILSRRRHCSQSEQGESLAWASAPKNLAPPRATLAGPPPLSFGSVGQPARVEKRSRRLPFPYIQKLPHTFRATRACAQSVP